MLSSRLNDLKIRLDKRLAKPFGVRAIMDGFRLVDEAGRSTSIYSDPLYFPFYYHLGREIQSENVLEFGFKLGLASGCFLRSCKSVKRFLAFQQKVDEYYSIRLGRANIKYYYKGDLYIHFGEITDDQYISELGKNKWSLVIINEEAGYDKHMAYMDLAWENMELDGLLVVDFARKNQAFADFVKVKNRQAVFFDTRYGVGIIQK